MTLLVAAAVTTATAADHIRPEKYRAALKYYKIFSSRILEIQTWETNVID